MCDVPKEDFKKLYRKLQSSLKAKDFSEIKIFVSQLYYVEFLN